MVAVNTYMEILCVFPNLTFFHVVLLCVLEALFKVLFDFVKKSILSGVQLTLDVVEGYRTFDLNIVVGILSLGR